MRRRGADGTGYRRYGMPGMGAGSLPYRSRPRERIPASHDTGQSVMRSLLKKNTRAIMTATAAIAYVPPNMAMPC